MIKLRIEALPDDVQDMLVRLTEAEVRGELELVSVSRQYANTRDPRDKRVRVYTDIRLTGGGACR